MFLESTWTQCGPQALLSSEVRLSSICCRSRLYAVARIRNPNIDSRLLALKTKNSFLHNKTDSCAVIMMSPFNHWLDARVLVKLQSKSCQSTHIRSNCYLFIVSFPPSARSQCIDHNRKNTLVSLSQHAKCNFFGEWLFSRGVWGLELWIKHEGNEVTRTVKPFKYPSDTHRIPICNLSFALM